MDAGIKKDIWSVMEDFAKAPRGKDLSKMKAQYQMLFHESIKRELKTRPIYECRCDERLKTKAEESTRLTYTCLL